MSTAVRFRLSTFDAQGYSHGHPIRVVRVPEWVNWTGETFPDRESARAALRLAK